MKKSLTHPGIAGNIETIMAYENGELNEEQIIELFSSLLRSGLAWQLQGSYGRTAADFINAGVLNAKGEILGR